MNMEPDNLTPQERSELDRLPRDIEPRAGLEDDVVRSLRAARLLSPDGTGRSRWLAAAAAAVVFFAVGLAVGRFVVPAGGAGSSGAGNSRYLLLLYGAEAATPEVERERVEEYSAWFREGQASGHFEGGEKLANASLVIGPSSPATWSSASELGGFFIVRASSFKEASQLAATCPHLRHGGTVVIRDIDE